MALIFNTDVVGTKFLIWWRLQSSSFSASDSRSCDNPRSDVRREEGQLLDWVARARRCVLRVLGVRARVRAGGPQALRPPDRQVEKPRFTSWTATRQPDPTHL